MASLYTIDMSILLSPGLLDCAQGNGICASQATAGRKRLTAAQRLLALCVPFRRRISDRRKVWRASGSHIPFSRIRGITMKNRTRTIAMTGTLLLGALGIASAKDVAVSLSGDQEVPAVTSTAKGMGTITIAEDKSVSGSVKTTGITGMMAHIHEAAPGKNGPPVITLEKKGDNEWVVPAGSKLTDAQYESFKAGNLYVNVHSAEHKGGEIRTQLKP
jgi:hypothetical protein